MSKTLTIITGASKGMGHAIAQQLLDAGDNSTVLAISRSASEALATHAQSCNATLIQWHADLNDAQSIAPKLAQWLQVQQSHTWQTVQLINNAGMIPSIAPLSGTSAADIARGMRVGLEAAMILSSCFLSATKHWPGQRKILNISSGLGRRALASQAVYCAAKAGMDNFTRCVALEEALVPNGAKVCALAPGVIDTGMQEQMRNTSADHFPGVERFQDLHAQNQLQSPEQAAQLVLAYLQRANFGEHAIGDVRD